MVLRAGSLATERFQPFFFAIVHLHRALRCVISVASTLKCTSHFYSPIGLHGSYPGWCLFCAFLPTEGVVGRLGACSSRWVQRVHIRTPVPIASSGTLQVSLRSNAPVFSYRLRMTQTLSKYPREWRFICVDGMSKCVLKNNTCLCSVRETLRRKVLPFF